MMNRRESIICGASTILGASGGFAICPRGNDVSDTPLEQFGRMVYTITVDKRGRNKPIVMYCFESYNGIFQCIIFDSPKKGAMLLGVEYMVGKKIYDKFDDNEKKLWHNHNFEIDCGAMVTPDQLNGGSYRFLHRIRETFGKTIMTWPKDYYYLPVGEPECWHPPTAKDFDPASIQHRDSDFNINTMKMVHLPKPMYRKEEK